MSKQPHLFGDRAVAAGLVTAQQVRQALAEQDSRLAQRKLTMIGELLVELGAMTPGQVLQVLGQQGVKVYASPRGRQYNIPDADPGAEYRCTSDGSTLQPLDPSTARKVSVDGLLHRQMVGRNGKNGSGRRATRVQMAPAGTLGPQVSKGGGQSGKTAQPAARTPDRPASPAIPRGPGGAPGAAPPVHSDQLKAATRVLKKPDEDQRRPAAASAAPITSPATPAVGGGPKLPTSIESPAGGVMLPGPTDSQEAAAASPDGDRTSLWISGELEEAPTIDVNRLAAKSTASTDTQPQPDTDEIFGADQEAAQVFGAGGAAAVGEEPSPMDELDDTIAEVPPDIAQARDNEVAEQLDADLSASQSGAVNYFRFADAMKQMGGDGEPMHSDVQVPFRSDVEIAAHKPAHSDVELDSLTFGSEGADIIAPEQGAMTEADDEGDEGDGTAAKPATTGWDDTVSEGPPPDQVGEPREDETDLQQATDPAAFAGETIHHEFEDGDPWKQALSNLDEPPKDQPQPAGAMSPQQLYGDTQVDGVSPEDVQAAVAEANKREAEQHAAADSTGSASDMRDMAETSITEFVARGDLDKILDSSERVISADEARELLQKSATEDNQLESLDDSEDEISELEFADETAVIDKATMPTFAPPDADIADGDDGSADADEPSSSDSRPAVVTGQVRRRDKTGVRNFVSDVNLKPLPKDLGAPPGTPADQPPADLDEVAEEVDADAIFDETQVEMAAIEDSKADTEVEPPPGFVSDVEVPTLPADLAALDNKPLVSDVNLQSLPSDLGAPRDQLPPEIADEPIDPDDLEPAANANPPQRTGRAAMVSDVELAAFQLPDSGSAADADEDLYDPDDDETIVDEAGVPMPSEAAFERSPSGRNWATPPMPGEEASEGTSSSVSDKLPSVDMAALQAMPSDEEDDGTGTRVIEKVAADDGEAAPTDEDAAALAAATLDRIREAVTSVGIPKPDAASDDTVVDEQPAPVEQQTADEAEGKPGTGLTVKDPLQRKRKYEPKSTRLIQNPALTETQAVRRDEIGSPELISPDEIEKTTSSDFVELVDVPSEYEDVLAANAMNEPEEDAGDSGSYALIDNDTRFLAPDHSAPDFDLVPHGQAAPVTSPASTPAAAAASDGDGWGAPSAAPAPAAAEPDDDSNDEWGSPPVDTDRWDAQMGLTSGSEVDTPVAPGEMSRAQELTAQEAPPEKKAKPAGHPVNFKTEERFGRAVLREKLVDPDRLDYIWQQYLETARSGAEPTRFGDELVAQDLMEEDKANALYERLESGQITVPPRIDIEREEMLGRRVLDEGKADPASVDSAWREFVDRARHGESLSFAGLMLERGVVDQSVLDEYEIDARPSDEELPVMESFFDDITLDKLEVPESLSDDDADMLASDIFDVSAFKASMGETGAAAKDDPFAFEAQPLDDFDDDEPGEAIESPASAAMHVSDDEIAAVANADPASSSPPAAVVPHQPFGTPPRPDDEAGSSTASEDLSDAAGIVEPPLPQAAHEIPAAAWPLASLPNPAELRAMLPHIDREARIALLAALMLITQTHQQNT